MMGSTDNILDRATWLAHEAERGGEHLLQARKELNGMPLGDRAKIAAQMERTSRVDHAKQPYRPELDVKPDPGHKDNYTVAMHKASPIEGTIRAGHDEHKMSGLAKTEITIGTAGGVGGAGIGAAGGYGVGSLATIFYGLDGTAAFTGMEFGALTGGAFGAAIGLGIGAASYGVHQLYELHKEDPAGFDLAMKEYLLHPPTVL
jgi:hypothetical protein